MVNLIKTISVKEAKKPYLNQDPVGKQRFGAGFQKFVQFSKRTDLHGFKYIVMEELNSFERGCWAFAVFVSSVVAIYFVITAYNWYARNPIVTVIESTQGAIWDVPFPAVTICDMNLVSRKAARAFASKISLPPNVTADFVFEAVRFAPLLHTTFPINHTQKLALRKLQRVLDVNKINIDDLFRVLSPVSSCSQLLERCMWKNSVYRCDQLFEQRFTLHRMCCSFNYYATPTVSTKLLRTSSAPRRVASCGYQTALTVLVHTDPDDFYSAFLASQGALVFIDDAHNVPDQDSPVRLVNPSSEVMIALYSERTYSTPGIRSFTPEQRQCYYHDEVKIKNFRQYSFHNCMIFQKVNIMKKICDCRPFYFDLDGDISRYCNFNDIDCLDQVLKLEESALKGNSGTLQCLPECEHFNYHFEVAIGAMVKHIHLNGHHFFKNVELENRSLLNVYYSDLVSTKYRRDVYLNWQNILAAFGGLLSLMLGFTLISGFDMVLFFTFKIFQDHISNFIKDDETQSVPKGIYKSKNKIHPNINKVNQTYYKNHWMDPPKKTYLNRW